MSSAARSYLAVVALGALLGSCNVSCSASRDMQSRKGGPRKRVLLAVKYALYEYQAAYRHLPYDSRSTEAALYQLHPFLDEQALPQVDERAPFRFDSSLGIVVGSPFDYLNEAGARFEDLPPNTVVLCEKPGCALRGQWLLLASGALTYTDNGGYAVGGPYED